MRFSSFLYRATEEAHHGNLVSTGGDCHTQRRTTVHTGNTHCSLSCDLNRLGRTFCPPYHFRHLSQSSSIQDNHYASRYKKLIDFSIYPTRSKCIRLFLVNAVYTVLVRCRNVCQRKNGREKDYKQSRIFQYKNQYLYCPFPTGSSLSFIDIYLRRNPLPAFPSCAYLAFCQPFPI